MLAENQRSEFIQWAIEQGVKIPDYIKIKDSKLGGSGVFINLDQIEIKGDIEVLRIPSSLKLSLDSIGQLLADQHKYDHENGNDEYLKQGEIFTTFLSKFKFTFDDNIDPLIKSGLNETNILVGEIQILIILKLVRDKLLDSSINSNYEEFLNNSPFKKFDKYFELLLNTDVSLFKLDKYYEEFLELFKYNQRDYRIKIEEIKNSIVINSLDCIDQDLGFNPKDLVNIQLLRQIEAAVISRILEIPEELKVEEPIKEQHGRFDDVDGDFRKVLRKEHVAQEEESTEQAGRYDNNDSDFRKVLKKEEEESYSFSVSSTLVPIIDFINHSNELVNSSFDVDKLNKDVLLRLDSSKFKNLSGEVELFITYSEVEDVYKFIHSYGFIPQSSDSVLFEHPIDRDYLLNYEIKGDKFNHNLGILLKWFGIQPNVQFVFKKDFNDIFLNLDENYLPFAFTKNLKYIPEHSIKIFKQLGGDELSSEYIKELIKLQESSKNDIVESFGLTPYISPDVSEDEDLLNIEYLVENTDDAKINELIAEFTDFLVEYLKLRLVKLNEFLTEFNDDSSIVVQFAKFEKDLINAFIKKHSNYKTVDEKVEHLILGADDLNEEWLKNRMRPIVIPVEDKLALHEKFMLEELKDLTFGRTEENDVTYEE